ncbi:rho GTPase-activating protein 20 [Chanos chanos]|uniref:Rho GTPase-activating protein 20 n=1 Tax=Chanos chanos TaxID=29144 RepID=A0A6J2WDR6_CHACN|nr:rho GTPase-activating protein 20-like [Chanos chanos]
MYSLNGIKAQRRSTSLGEESGGFTQSRNRRNAKTPVQRRQSAPSLIISRALTMTKTAARETVSVILPESCPLVQSLLSPTRSLIHYGSAQLQMGLQRQERTLFLFTDLIIISKAKSPAHMKPKACVRVCEMWTACCMEEVCESPTSPDRSFVMGWPVHNCVATFSTPEQKEKWLTLIENRITEEKKKDDPKSIPLKIFAKDVGSCAYTKTVSVANTDRTTDVINTARQQLGLTGAVSDYQLWVCSGSDEPPYPLIGHEFPYSIQMRHMRQSRPTAVTPTYPSGALLPTDAHCQFILRPTTQNLTVEQRTVKRKRSIKRINWPFRRNSVSQLDGQLSSLTSSCPAIPTPGRLIGRPLGEVFKDRLPPPIMDMLVCLCKEGSKTHGIFRRSAGVAACRDLSEKLDCGYTDTLLSGESALVISSVFKHFLRNIPDSLLCEELYEQWLRVMEEHGEIEEERERTEHRIERVQRLLELLPKENLLLLKFVVAMLHHIQSNAEHNQMNSYNLSVCIAPSLLWGRKLQPQGEDTKKVCELVCFLIDNCSAVFGDDITTIFSGLSEEKSNSHENALLVQMADSCYSSLENELSTNLESMPQTLPNTQSTDSLITLSDSEDTDQSESDLEVESPFLPSRDRVFVAPARKPLSQLRRRSEPIIRHARSSLEVQSETRKASLDSSRMHEEENDEENGDEVFLPHSFQRLRLSPRERAVFQRRRRKRAPPLSLRLDDSRSSPMSIGTSTTGSSVSSLDSSFSQSSDDNAHIQLTLSSPQNSPPKQQFNSTFQKRTQHSITDTQKIVMKAGPQTVNDLAVPQSVFLSQSWVLTVHKATQTVDDTPANNTPVVGTHCWRCGNQALPPSVRGDCNEEVSLRSRHLYRSEVKRSGEENMLGSREMSLTGVERRRDWIMGSCQWSSEDVFLSEESYV